jgi:CDP-diglyceride synthetase
MRFDKLDRGEAVAVIGGLLLAGSMFLTWYTLGNQYASLGSCKGPNGSCSGWLSLGFLSVIIVIAAIAPVVLAYIIVRGHALSWPRGELTAVCAQVALVLTIFRGFIDKPGSPTGEIHISYGWVLAMVGGFLILLGALVRSQETGGRRKKPPGVL